MSDNNGKYRESVIYHLVYCELIRAARYRGLTTYQAIAQIMGLPMSGNHMSKETGQIIGEIAEDEVKNGRPMLSAVVVGVSGKPGSGFIPWAKKLERIDQGDEITKEEFWKQELTAVYEAWKPEFKS